MMKIFQIKMQSKKYPGFTIVELLIVIVVIGVLAALVLNSFAGAQAKARDSKRRDDATKISKALQAWSVNNQKPLSQLGGGASNGSGYGWFDYAMPTIPNSGNYAPISIKGVIVSANLIGSGVGDPKYVRGSYDYCVWMSNDYQQWGVFARLEQPTAGDASVITGLQSSGSWSGALSSGACGAGSAANSNYAKTFAVPNP